jgi:hypothetical protein
LKMKFSKTTKLLLISACMMLSFGCATAKPRVISSDREIKRIYPNKPFVSPIPGWCVPDALWLEINEALEKEAQ